jgi:regulator of nucleoside diphosphate kinase
LQELETMNDKRIFVTKNDAKRLQALLEVAKRSQYYGSDNLQKLGAELNRATVVASNSIPQYIITMNSRVRLLDLETREEMTYTLVFPDAADITEGKISVLAPIGTAMLGYRAGDTFSWEVPAGVRRIKVLEVLYQPEASGDYHL